MEKKYKVVIAPKAVREDWPNLPKVIQERIGTSIMSKLSAWPEIYGKPLSASLKNNRKLRVGDYRVIFSIKEKTVKIWAIGHRSIIYAMAIKRLNAEFQ